VTPYDTAASAGHFAQSRQLFDTLIIELTGPDTAEITHAQLEDLVNGRGRDVLRQLIQDHLDLRAVREEQDLAARMRAGDRPAGRTRLERGHVRKLATIFGTVTVRRAALRAAGEPNIYPADAKLSLPPRRHSHGIAHLAVREAIRSSYDTTYSVINARCGSVAGKRQLENLVTAAATDVDAFYAAMIPEPVGADTLLVLSADAKGIVMRPDSLREATRRKAARATPVFRTRVAPGQTPHRKRMATLAAVYDAEPAPRRPHDVISVPGGPRSGDRVPRPGPHANSKWLTASVTDTTEQVIAAAFDHAEARDPTHDRTWVVLVDGAWHQIEVIETEAARRGIDIHIVVDLIHVIEYCWAGVRCFHACDDPAAEDRVAEHVLALLAGNVHTVAEAFQTQAEAAGLTGEKRRTVDDTVRYLRGHADYLRYDHALSHGWPIATGVIEGAARHLIADRLEISGARWGLTGAEAILRLRAVTSNNDLDRYWAFHLEQEHKRLHPENHQLAA
jgi:hypothetical protein